MRALLALIAFVSSLAAISPVHARSYRHHDHHGHGYYEARRHASPLVIYEYNPGVIVRAYWIAPWRNRHYFPKTGEKPELGREEDLTAASPQVEPAESFHRSWSTSSAFGNEDPRASAPRFAAPEARGEALPDRNQDQTQERVKP